MRMKEVIALALLLMIVYCNIWDNLYSNEIRAGDKPDGLKNSNSKWVVANSYLFRNYSFRVFLSPNSSLVSIKLYHTDQEVLVVMLNFLTNEAFYQFTGKICQRIVLPDIIKLDLTNINNLRDFIFFKESDGVYKLDIPYFTSLNMLPAVTLKIEPHQNDQSPERTIEIQFVTKTLMLKSTPTPQEELNAESQLSQFEQCDSVTNLQAFSYNLSTSLIQNLVTNTYNSLKSEFKVSADQIN